MNRAFEEWERKTNEELAFWFSKEGIELQLCLISQGYENRLMERLMVMFGSGFTAYDIIKNQREKYLK